MALIAWEMIFDELVRSEAVKKQGSSRLIVNIQSCDIRFMSSA